MKKIMAAVFIMLLIPIGYLGAEDKQPADPKKDSASVSSKENLSTPVEQAYYIFKKIMTTETGATDFLDCIKGQQRSIDYGKKISGNSETKPYQKYHSSFWVTIQCGK
jgi:hypothetical protein